MYQTIKRLIPSSIRKAVRDGQHSIIGSQNRSLARRLSSRIDDDTTGLSYMFEVQPYSFELVLQGYMLGIFCGVFYKPGYAHWYDPSERSVLPIHEFHVPANLRRALRKENFEYRINSDFQQVMERCSQGRTLTHMTDEYKSVYMQFHEMGLAHSVSVWKDGEMVGGRFGVAIGGYFCGESSFQTIPNAGKASLIRTAEILAHGGFVLRDEGWPTEFMRQFGERAVSRNEFHKLHSLAITVSTRFDPDAPAIFSPTDNGKK